MNLTGRLLALAGPPQHSCSDEFVEWDGRRQGCLGQLESKPERKVLGMHCDPAELEMNAEQGDLRPDLPEGVPSLNFNVFSLLKKKFPSDTYELVFINTGVVEGICRLHTSIGLRQMFPFDRIINISNATTPLYGVGLGYNSAEESRQASTRVCKDIGIEYMTTEECLKEFG